MAISKWSLVAPIAIMFIVLLSVAPIQQASAATATVITATGAQTPVKIDGIVEQGEWSDTQMVTISVASMTVAFKYNSTGLLFLMQWNTGTGGCVDQNCYGGIELGFLNNTAVMGSTFTPTVMVLLSPSFKGGFDEFVSQGATTPSTVESGGYKSQSACALVLSGTAYTGECYRPFKLNKASPYDPFPSLVAGSSIEIGFAVGDFANPGQHAATNMNTYVLVLGPAATTTSTSTTTSTTTSTPTSTNTTSTTPTTSNTTSTTTTTTSHTTPTYTTTTTTTTSTSTSSQTPLSTLYAEELTVLVLGFSVIIVLVIRKYPRNMPGELR
jgi:hypothetical protein